MPNRFVRLIATSDFLTMGIEGSPIVPPVPLAATAAMTESTVDHVMIHFVLLAQTNIRYVPSELG